MEKSWWLADMAVLVHSTKYLPQPSFMIRQQEYGRQPAA
jgi:hypothetical protein